MSVFVMRLECDGCEVTADFEAPEEWHQARWWMEGHVCKSDGSGS